VENAKLKWKIENQAIDVISPKEAEAATSPEESTQSKSKKKPDASVLDSY
jgi:hypothetical protein